MPEDISKLNVYRWRKRGGIRCSGKTHTNIFCTVVNSWNKVSQWAVGSSPQMHSRAQDSRKQQKVGWGLKKEGIAAKCFMVGLAEYTDTFIHLASWELGALFTELCLHKAC